MPGWDKELKTLSGAKPNASIGPGGGGVEKEKGDTMEDD